MAMGPKPLPDYSGRYPGDWQVVLKSVLVGRVRFSSCISSAVARVFCGFNRTPNRSSIRVAAANAARASGTDLQVITQSSANRVS